MSALKSENQYWRVIGRAQTQASALRVQAEKRGHRRSPTKVKHNTVSTNKQRRASVSHRWVQCMEGGGEEGGGSFLNNKIIPIPPPPFPEIYTPAESIIWVYLRERVQAVLSSDSKTPTGVKGRCPEPC